MLELEIRQDYTSSGTQKYVVSFEMLRREPASACQRPGQTKGKGKMQIITIISNFILETCRSSYEQRRLCVVFFSFMPKSCELKYSFYFSFNASLRIPFSNEALSSLRAPSR